MDLEDEVVDVDLSDDEDIAAAEKIPQQNKDTSADFTKEKIDYEFGERYF
jgi:hypothetical protein